MSSENTPERAEPPQAPELPKYRLVAVNDNAITETQDAVNSLADDGYELQAVSGTFMLMVLFTAPQMDPQQQRMMDLLEQRYGENGPQPPPLEFDIN